MPFSESEARIRRLTARLTEIEYEVQRLKENRGKISQDLAQVFSALSSTCLTTIDGKVIGCLATPTALPGSSIHVFGNTSGFDYGTYSLGAGTFLLGLYLLSSDTSLDFIVTGPGARFVASGTQTRSVTHCTTNTLADLTKALATGYLCNAALCNFPIATTLSVTDSRFGATTVTSGGGDWVHVGAPGYTFSAAGVVAGRLVTDSTGMGPVNASWGLPGSVTCADAGGTKFDATWTANAGMVNVIAQGYVVGDTIRIYEP